MNSNEFIESLIKIFETGGRCSNISLSGEKEKGGSASKTSLPQEHDMDTEAQRYYDIS